MWQEKVLAIHRHSVAGYIVILTASSGDTVHDEPFEDVELCVGVLLADEDDDE